MVNSSPPDRRHWFLAALVLGLLCTPSSFVLGQSRQSRDSAQTESALKRAVVIVTTLDREGKPLLQGSGFFIATDRVATNMHVIRDAAVIRIETFSGERSTALRIIAVNEQDDLAVLQLENPLDVPILKVTDTPPLEGETIAVMSSPRGARWKLTRGEVGPLWEFKGTGKRFQISASILPGSSGGPVVNHAGQVVGVAVMHFDGSDELNFAVPARALMALQASTKLALLDGPRTGR